MRAKETPRGLERRQARRLSLRAKLLAFMLPLALGSTLLMSYSARKVAVAIATEQLSKRAAAMAQGLAQLPETAGAVAAGGEQALIPLLQGAIRNGAAYAMVLDTEGRVLAHSNLLERGKLYRDEASLEAVRSGSPTSRRSGPVLDTAAPVWEKRGRTGEEFVVEAGQAPPRRLGTIRIGLPLAQELETAAQFSRQIGWVLIFINAATLGLLLLFLRHMVRPVVRLASAAERLGGGHLGETVEVSSSDEVGELARSFNRMSAQLARITVSKSYLDAILRNMHDALFVAAPGGEIRMLNASALRLVGGTEADWVGRDARQLFVGRDGPAAELLRGEGALREAVLISKAGERIPVLCAAAPFSEAEAGKSLIISASDIRELKAAQAEMAEKAAELARSNKALEEFAFVASHDLQEPLRKVITFAEIIAQRHRKGLDAEAERYLGIVIGGARRMQALVRDLLNMSLVAHGEVVRRPVDLGRALESALAELDDRIRESRARVTHGPLPTVAADEAQMVLLLQNLVANALKFRRQEPPVVHIDARDAAHEWIVSVSDRGIGIAPEHLEKIFVIFQRLHPRTEFPGTGVGLALCKKIVERFGGRIWAESRVGEGSIFRFALPKE